MIVLNTDQRQLQSTFTDVIGVINLSSNNNMCSNNLFLSELYENNLLYVG